MAKPVIMGDSIECTEGEVPATMIVPPNNKIMGMNKPMATILDNKPGANITTFGRCKSKVHPVFIVTGVNPPCTPIPVTPWLPGAPTVACTTAGPLLNDSSKCVCTFSGRIEISQPTAETIKVP